MPNLNSIPTVFKRIYKKKVNGLLMLYNTFSLKGFILLNQQSVLLYKHIDGTKKIKDYLEFSSKLGLGMNKKQVLNVFNNLYKHDIINFESKTYFDPILETKENEILTVWLDLTNQCNFRCTYCFIEKKAKKMNQSMIENIIDKLYFSYKKHKYKKVRLVLGGGEPLLELDLIKKIVLKVRQIEGKNKIFDMKIISNGSLITEEISSYLRDNNIKIGISLDGLGEINDYTRKLANGSGTFKYIKKGLDLAIKYHILFNINITITSINIKEIKALTDFCLKNNIRASFSLYKKTNEFCNEGLIFYQKQLISVFKEVLKKIYRYYEINKIFYPPLYNFRFVDIQNFLFELSNHSCSAGKNYFVISPEGKIKHCPSAKIHLSSILDKDMILKARNACFPLLKKMSVDNIGTCKNCLWKYICSGGCMSERLYLDKNKPSYKCELYKSLIPMILGFEAKRIINNSFLSFIDQKH